MKELQRVIKYLAMAFAVFIIVNIVTSIVLTLTTFTSIFTDDTHRMESVETISVVNNANVLDIDVNNVNITIKEGSAFKVETNSSDIECKQNDNQLILSEKAHNWFFDNHDEVIVYVPDSMQFDAVSIRNGTGKIKINQLYTKKLALDQGASKVEIDYLEVKETAEIKGGVGKATIQHGKIHDLHFKVGVGKLSLTAQLIGNHEIEGGVGKVDIHLIGSNDDYKLKIKEGIGSIDVTDLTNSNNEYGNGENYIVVKGGIGSIDVALKK